MLITKPLDRYYSRFTVLLMACLFSINVYALQTLYHPANLNELQSELTALKQFVNSKSDNYFSQLSAIQDLLVLEKKINDSIVADEQQLNLIKPLLKQIQSTAPLAQLTDFDKKTKTQQTALLNRITISNVLNYNLNQVITQAYSYGMQRNPFNLKTQVTPIWQTIGISTFSSITINWQRFYQRSGLDVILNKTSLIGLLSILMGSFMLSFIVCILGARWLIKKLGKTSGLDQLLPVIKRTVPLVLSLFLVDIYLYNLFDSIRPIPTLIWMVTALLLYTIIRTGIRLDLANDSNGCFWPNAIHYYAIFIMIVLFFYNYAVLIISLSGYIPLTLLDYRIPAYTAALLLVMLFFLSRNRSAGIEQTIVVPFLKRVLILCPIAIGCLMLVILSAGLDIPTPFVGLRNTVFIILYNASLLWLSWLVFRVNVFAQCQSRLRLLTAKIMLLSFYLLPIIAAWNGYYHFALLWVPNIATTILLLFIVFYLNQLLKNGYDVLINSQHRISRKFHDLFDVNPGEKRMIELVILRFLIMTVPIVIAFIAVDQIWGMRVYTGEMIIEKLNKGVAIFQVTIFPIRILRATFLFFMLLLMGRFLANRASKQTKILENLHLRSLVRSLVSYMVFFVASLVALFVAGVDLSGLMVVMGGLSFGLGFGFKQFASDAGSGLYIMLDKAIRLGDHITVGAVEGTVKKIGLLSTQILTAEHSDVIIPNSSLLSTFVINYTFLDDKSYRLQLVFSLENMLNIDQAKTLLIETVSKNPNVILTAPYKPSVFLELNRITLQCEINDVERKQAIASELIESISNVFNEKKIKLFRPV